MNCGVEGHGGRRKQTPKSRWVRMRILGDGPRAGEMEMGTREQGHLEGEPTVEALVRCWGGELESG